MQAVGDRARCASLRCVHWASSGHGPSAAQGHHIPESPADWRGRAGTSLVLGFAAIRRRDIAWHRAWMIRGYAIALGAGTQVLTNVPWLLFVGKPEGLSRALLMAAGWLINVGVAEWIIRRRDSR